MASVITNKMFQDNQDPTSLGNSEEIAVNQPPLEDQVLKDLVQMFKLLSDETRLRILFHLKRQDELNVRELCGLLGQSQPAVSHHLALLRVAGLIECRRDGKHNFYHLMPKRFHQLVEMIFSAVGEQGADIRFDEHVLSYSHDAPED